MTLDSAPELRSTSFAELRRAFDDALDSGSDRGVSEIVTALSEMTDEAISSADLATVTQARATVARLLGRAARRRSEDTAQTAIAALRPLADMLARSRTILATRARNDRRRRDNDASPDRAGTFGSWPPRPTTRPTS